MFATATRSNGSFLFIFPLCFSINKLFTAFSKKTLSFSILFKEGILLLSAGLLQALPIFLVLSYAYSLYCKNEPSPYCSGLFPNAYSYVQEKY